MPCAKTSPCDRQGGHRSASRNPHTDATGIDPTPSNPDPKIRVAGPEDFEQLPVLARGRLAPLLPRASEARALVEGLHVITQRLTPPEAVMTPTRRRANAAADANEPRHPTAPATTQDSARKKSTRAQNRQSPASTRHGAPTQPPARDTAAAIRTIEVPDALEGEAYPGEEKVKIGTTLPVHLKGQVDGAVRFAQDSGGIDGVETITDFIRVACHRLVTDLQTKHNDGNEFLVPRINRRGRMPGR